MLAEMVSCGRASLCTARGGANTSRRRSAATSALSASGPSTNTTNSSPPRRPMESDSRRALRKREATCRSTSSPTRCPSESFTSLNRSRSMNNTAPSPPLPVPLFCTCSIRSSIRVRLGKPVRASRVASRSSSVAGRTELGDVVGGYDQPVDRRIFDQVDDAQLARNRRSAAAASEGNFDHDRTATGPPLVQSRRQRLLQSRTIRFDDKLEKWSALHALLVMAQHAGDRSRHRLHRAGRGRATSGCWPNCGPGTGTVRCRWSPLPNDVVR